MFIAAKERHFEIKEAMRGGDGSVQLETLPKEQLPLHCRLAGTLTLKPGCSIGTHAHEGETEIFCFVSGRGQVEDNGQVIAVQAGDMLTTGCGGTHGVKNTGDQDLVLTACIVTEA